MPGNQLNLGVGEAFGLWTSARGSSSIRAEIYSSVLYAMLTPEIEGMALMEHSISKFSPLATR